MLQQTLGDLRDKVDVMHFDALAKKYRMSRAFDEKDQSFGARFLVHLEKTKQEPEYDAALIDEAQDFDPSWFQCALRLMRDPHVDEQRMLFYVALTRAKDFLAAIPKECRDLLLFLLKMALYDREWLFAVIVIFSPFHALRANCSLSRGSLF